MSDSQRIKEIEKEFTKLGLIDAIPIVMIALGIHAKFGKSGEPIFELLKNDFIVYGMFFVSIPVVLWCIYIRLSS